MATCIDTITCFKDSLSGSSFEALTIASGDSLSLRFLDPSAQIYLVEAWGGNNATKCDFSIRSPLLHDNTRGIRFAHQFNPTTNVADGNPQLYMGEYEQQRYYPSDTLVVEALGAASDDVTFTQMIVYEGNVPAAQLIDYNVLKNNIVNLLGNRVSPSAAASTSTYGTAEAITTDDNRFKANTYYALLGHTTDLPHTTLTVRGPETVNLRMPMPGSWDARKTANWFPELSRRFNRPMIPVFLANNNGSNIFVEVADAGGGTTPLTCLKWAELSRTFQPFAT